jgi:cell division protein FtsW
VWWIYGIVVALLVLCFVPGIGMERNEERRWISAGLIGLTKMQLQPSELAKIAIAVVLAHWFTMHPDRGKHPLYGFLYPGLLVGGIVVLVLFEVDLGTALILSATCFTLFFVAGLHWGYLTTVVVSGVGAFMGMLWLAPHKMVRIEALFELEKHIQGAGLQQWVALMALGSGGPEGLGLGNGRLKMLYMPFAHTDFIFPMIGEELGLGFTLLVVFAFLLIGVAGTMIAFHAPDRFGKLLAIGLVCFVVSQGVLNIGVTTAVLPNTGLPLPFISYGGSALLAAMAAVGVLLNIHRQAKREDRDRRLWAKGPRLTPRV